uniref:Uncharacterized protein n=1 Tax=Arundo donax TaxID=35708 RepID=A0A0A9C363_ARUDO
MSCRPCDDGAGPAV